MDFELDEKNVVRMTWDRFDENKIKALATAAGPKADAPSKDVIRFPLDRFDAVCATFLDQLHPAEMKAYRFFKDFVYDALTSSNAKPVTELNMSEAVSKTLYAFQHEGIRRMVFEMGGRCLLADEMGLGKTIQALSVAHHYGGNILVACPPPLAENWERECKKWLPTDGSVYVQRFKKDTDPIKTPPSGTRTAVYIVSYTLLTLPRFEKNQQLAKDRRWDVVICDESHAFINLESERSKCMLPILKATPHILLISGTPMVARPSELYVQMTALFADRKFGKIGWFEFTERWCEGFRHPAFGWDATGCSRFVELSEILAKRMIRRKQDDVLSSLPKLTQNIVRIQVSSFHKAQLAEMRKEMKVYAMKAHAKDGNERERRANLMLLKQTKSAMYVLTGQAKITAVRDYVAKVANDKVTIFFGCHIEMQKAIDEALTDAGISHIAIFGDTDMSKRLALVDQIATGHVQAAALSAKAAGTGLNFTPRVEHVVLTEIPWGPNDTRQIVKRAHRIGCKKPITVTILIAEGTLDDELFATNVAKDMVNTAVVDAGVSDGGFIISSTTSDMFAGYELEKYGVQKQANRVKVLPRKDEPMGAYVSRACVPLDAEDAADFLEYRFGEYHATNKINVDKKTRFYNLIEWGEKELPEFRVAFVLIGNASEDEIKRVKALPSSYERATELANQKVVAVFVPVIPSKQ